MKVVSDWELIKQSYLDLYRIYKPTDLDSFTKNFCKKYGIPGIYKDDLKRLVSNNA